MITYSVNPPLTAEQFVAILRVDTSPRQRLHLAFSLGAAPPTIMTNIVRIDDARQRPSRRECATIEPMIAEFIGSGRCQTLTTIL